MTRRPEDCADMAELRREVDRVDAALVALLAERVGYIDRAAEIKRSEGLPARIPDRVETVIANVRAAATAARLCPDFAERTWRGIVEWSIAREERALGVEERDG